VIVWRICKELRAPTAFDGEGARRNPGRWNHKGVPMVYCAGSLALASLEVFVHLDPDDWPDDLVSIAAEVPDELLTDTVDPKSLPSGWNKIPPHPRCGTRGTAWAKAAGGVALIVPSAIIPNEKNVLLNPKHADMARVVRHPPQRFTFDPRMRK
jgi:RES domain-containing protein